MIKACCDRFQWLVNEAGTAGLSIIVRHVGHEYGFFLQGRACDADQEQTLQHIISSIVVPQSLRIVTQQGIQFCPFCGTPLIEVMHANANELCVVAPIHKLLEL